MFIAEETSGKRANKMDHLTCFVPGMLMLGIAHLPEKDINSKWFDIAERVTETCYKMYGLAHTGTGG